jgi:hypothetical protein
MLSEIVIGFGSVSSPIALTDRLSDLDCTPVTAAPGVWQLPTAVTEKCKQLQLPLIRLVPSPMSSLVLHVSNVESAHEVLHAAGVSAEWIGRAGNGYRSGQLRIHGMHSNQSNDATAVAAAAADDQQQQQQQQQQHAVVWPFAGLDVRLCDNDVQKPLAFFCEGSEGLLDGLMPSVQSSRVLDTTTATDSNSSAENNTVTVTQTTITQDRGCWSEFAGMMTHPMGFLSKNKNNIASSSSSSDSAGIRRILSPPPTSRAAAKRAKKTAEYSLREY